MVPSPCIGVCALDGRSNTCTGCGRTLDEIAAWPTMTDDARRAVLTRLAERRAPDRGDGEGDRPPARDG